METLEGNSDAGPTELQRAFARQIGCHGSAVHAHIDSVREGMDDVSGEFAVARDLDRFEVGQHDG
jgi:hypothetical protein